jgi:hypothetical protein
VKPFTSVEKVRGYRIEAAEVSKFNPFPRRPDALVRIQFRSVGGEVLEMEAWRGPVREELLNGMAAVHGRSIPDDHQPALRLTPQVLQKGYHIFRIQGVVLAVEGPLARRRDRTDGGEVIAGPPFPQDRRVPHRGIGADDARQGIKA